ncbi:uncharacterized mitochondrial protein-like protein [Tanacetum coccineum]
MVVGESSQPPVKDTTLTFQCPILTSTYYTIWRMRMEVRLGIHRVWDVVDPGSDDAKKNNIVKGLLFQSIPEDLVLQIGNLKIRKEMWEAIKTLNLGADCVKEARLQTLITEFENMKMLDNGTIDEYAAKLSGIASKSATLGELMSEHKLVKKFLTSLSRRFIHIVAALEQVLDLKTTGFEDVVGRLKAYEERVKEEDKENDPQENLLYARTKYFNGNNDSSGGRGRGSYSRGRGRGRGQGRGRDNSQNQCQRDSSKNLEDNERKEKYTPPKSESNTDEDDVWYFDNSASNHMIALRSNVISLGQATISGYDISIRGDFLTIRDSWGSLLIKVSRNENRLYKAQLKVGKENINEVGRESGTFTVLCNDIQENGTNQVIDEEANPHSSLVTDHETSPESEEDHSRSDDTPIPIARLETIRLLIALAAGKGWKIHHLDVKTAFLHGELKEEVYVVQPEGFEKPGEEEKVYKLAKSLYGLTQAPQAWNVKLDNTLKEMGFQQCMQEKAVYKAVTNGEFIIVAVYVDDLFVTGTSLDCINEFKRRMASQFEMSDLGELTYYLGIEVSQGKDCVEIKQERYARKILKEADLTYSVGVVSRYMQSPRESHARAIKQILRYLEGTTSFGIKYNRSNDMKLVGYSDSSHNVDIMMDEALLDMFSTLFMAATAAACQAIWLRELLAEVTGLERQKVIIRVDNKSAIALSKNPVFHGRSKHIHTRYHFIREYVENEQVIVEHVSGENQRAYPLTKALARIRFKEMRSLLGVQELPSSTQKFRGFWNTSWSASSTRPSSPNIE